MKLVRLFNRIRWIAKISFIILFFLERQYYFEGLPTEDSNIIKYFKIAFLVIFIIASLVENKLIIKGKNREIETLKRQLNEKT
ncbi:hypothetical protein [uncultured Lacinutrix sp.]|uniref:hypothetical protein n=1 Tax=uncultured Lacinutrix sp. TaxID=574032 RepID=UPI00260F00E2|nr:hypothetical protein [uncultured Lacinutrix sp.]